MLRSKEIKKVKSQIELDKFIKENYVSKEKYLELVKKNKRLEIILMEVKNESIF